MRKLNITEHAQISGGECSDACGQATIDYINNCSFADIEYISTVFITVLSSEAMQGADDQHIRDALIAALLSGSGS